MSTPRPVVVLVAGDPIPSVRSSYGAWPDLIRRAAGPTWNGPFRDVDLRDGSPLPAPSEMAGAVITGSASSVTERAAWMFRGEEYLRGLVAGGVPVFGICFGHQMLGQALGGRVVKNPLGREIGTVDLEVVAEDPIFDGAVAPHRANATHVDTLAELPVGSRVLARTHLEPHAAVRFTETAWGVQFHPEIDGSVVRRYLEARRELILGEGGDLDALLAAADDGQVGRSTLVRFLELVERTES